VPFTQEVTREAIKYILKESVNERVEFNGRIRDGYAETLDVDDADDLIGYFNGGESYGDRMFREHSGIIFEERTTSNHPS
jgi:hypothetical protein